MKNVNLAKKIQRNTSTEQIIREIVCFFFGFKVMIFASEPTIRNFQRLKSQIIYLILAMKTLFKFKL